MTFRRLCTSAALVLAAAWAHGAQAAVVQLAPIPVEVEAPAAAAILSLTNKATAAVALQVRAFRWTQVGGEDRLEPTEDLAISPPIASVPAGETLSVRIVRLRHEPPSAEEAYRLWIDELPSDRGKTKTGRLSILTRYSVPAFFRPEGATKDEPALAWSILPGKKGWVLGATNPGARRVRVSAIQVRDASGKPAFAPGGEQTGYVLAGQAMHWDLQLPKGFATGAGGAWQLEYDTEARAHREAISPGANR